MKSFFGSWFEGVAYLGGEEETGCVVGVVRKQSGINAATQPAFWVLSATPGYGIVLSLHKVGLPTVS